ncbi:CL049 protein, partial [Acromyrmex heyeri]
SNKCEETWEYLEGFDIVGLVETKTWIDEERWEKIKNRLPKDYEWNYVPAKKKHKKGRAKGGIITAVSKKVKNIEVREISEAAMECEMNYNGNKWRIITVYSQEIEKTMERLMEHIQEEKEGYLIIEGDARTGNEGGLVIEEENEKRNKSRKSIDKIINKGRRLIGRIEERGWAILNGSFEEKETEVEIERSDWTEEEIKSYQEKCKEWRSTREDTEGIWMEEVLSFSLQKGQPNLDNNFDMDPMMINDNNEDMIPDDNLLEELRASDKSPLWQIEILDQAADNAGNIDTSNLNESDAYNQSCRNSIQGRGLIVDDHGIVCSRHEVQSNGCCAIEQKQSSKNEESFMTRRERYSCKTCNSQGCCTIYEYCVSCCLHPDKQIRGRKDLSSGSAKVQKNVGRTAVHFQICLAACRTSSSSVRRDNTYKDPLAKHCYIPQR